MTNNWKQGKDGKWYFCGKNGAMATSKIIDWKGKKYFVDDDGVMAVNRTITDMNTKRRGGLLIPDLAGMRAWFTLQHYKKFEGKLKLFTNYEIVEYEFEGDLNERQYDIVEEELKGIREKIMKEESK